MSYYSFMDYTKFLTGKFICDSSKQRSGIGEAVLILNLTSIQKLISTLVWKMTPVSFPIKSSISPRAQRIFRCLLSSFFSSLAGRNDIILNHVFSRDRERKAFKKVSAHAEMTRVDLCHSCTRRTPFSIAQMLPSSFWWNLYFLENLQTFFMKFSENIMSNFLQIKLKF